MGGFCKLSGAWPATMGRCAVAAELEVSSAGVVKDDS